MQGGLVVAVRELRIAHARVTLIQGEPIDHPRKALYAAVNARGVLASGFSGAIRLAGGSEIERELRERAPLLVGEAYSTGPGKLAERGVERIIFGVTTAEPGGAPRRDHAERAVQAGLALINHERIRSATFPEVGVRVGGIALADAADMLIDALDAHFRRGTLLEDVVIAGSHLEYLRACRDLLFAIGATEP
jgi:O-acetyl-ADP-ribose deacetylase (regulator of RNase III)